MNGLLTPSWQKPPRGAVLDRSHPLSRADIAHFLLNENGGTRINSAGGGMGGVLSGGGSLPTWVATSEGSALRFLEASTQYAALDNVTGRFGTTNLSMFCRVYVPSTNLGGAWVKLGDAVTGIGLGMGNTSFDTNGNKLTALYEDKRWIVSSHLMTVGWHTCGVVVDGLGFPHIYADGVQVFTDTINLGMVRPANAVTLGGYQAGASPRYIDCSLTWVALYARALTATEIASLYAAPYQMVAPAIPDSIYYSFGAQTRFRRTLLTGGMADYTGRIHG